MMTLSLAMIARNEERVIERALRSAKEVCDELIVVDTGSTDRTIEIAQSAGAKIHHFEWIDDFSAARNVSFDHCTSDWILILDADDVIPDLTQRYLLDWKARGMESHVEVIEMIYNYQYDDEGRCTESQWMPRIARNLPHLRWKSPVHESLQFDPSRCIQFPDSILIEHRQEKSRGAERVERAQRIIERALREGTSDPRIVFYAAWDKSVNGLWDEAAQLFDLYIKIAGDTTFTTYAMIYLSIALTQAGNADGGYEWARRAAEREPHIAEPYVLMGHYHLLRDEIEIAIPFFHHVLTLQRPNKPFAIDGHYTWQPLDFLSSCYERLGDVPRAIDYAQQALAFGCDTERILGKIAILEQYLAQHSA